MHIEFKKLMQCKQAHEYAQIKCKQKRFMSLLPLHVCFSFVQEFWSIIFSFNVAPLSMSILISPPWNISFVVQLIPWSYLCSNFSSFVINFHKRYVIPIKSLDTIWKSVHLIVTKDCIGIDGWGLNLVFLMDITICVWMTLLELLLRYHIGSLTLIPFGGALPLCHSMGHSLVNLVGEGTCFAWWSLKVEDHLWNHLLVWYIPYVQMWYHFKYLVRYHMGFFIQLRSSSIEPLVCYLEHLLSSSWVPFVGYQLKKHLSLDIHLHCCLDLVL